VVWTEARVELWRRTGERPAVAVWTAEQTATFLEQIRDHQLYPLYHVAALLGLCRGEAVGLRWCDVDLASRTLSVVRQLVERDGRGVCLPKTEPAAGPSRWTGARPPCCAGSPGRTRPVIGSFP
jgi:integrase